LTQVAQRIGVFGGAFDPPHVAHVALAQAALEQLELDQLKVFPTGQAWHKPQAPSAAQHRLAMARLAFENLPHVCVDAREIQRTGPTYTIDTLLALQAENPSAQLFLILGEDQARALPNWHRWQEILKLAIICVAIRHATVDHIDELNPFIGLSDVAAGHFQRLILAPMNVGSTHIRQLAASGQAVTPLVSEPVARYISLHHLYLNPR
jgi:nicotinate-nucleotide adenylyltransferase